MNQSYKNIFFIVTCTLFTFNFKFIGYWYDHHRLIQILLIIIASLWIFWDRKYAPTTHGLGQGKWLITAFLGCGLLATLSGTQAHWHWTELCLWLGCLAIFHALIQHCARMGLDRFQRGIHLLVLTVASVLLLQFCFAYLNGLHAHSINTHRLVPSFDNPRFAGQLITLLLPVLGALAMTSQRIPRSLAALLLVGMWTLVIANGTRGTWLAMALVMAIVVWTGPLARRWVGWQAVTAAAGIALASLLFLVIPQWLGIDVQNPAADRLHLGLSAREIIWSQAWEMLLAAPWLGHGPMAFAQLHSVAGAHPHQILLQLAAEWGGIATVLFCAIAGWALVGMLKKINHGQKISNATEDDRSQKYLYIGASTAVAAALMQSMVDGVFVVPSTQLFFTIIAAYAYALHHADRNTPLLEKNNFLWQRAYAIAYMVAAVVLAYSLIPYSPTSLQNAYHAFEINHHLKPRFWSQGFI